MRNSEIKEKPEYGITIFGKQRFFGVCDYPGGFRRLIECRKSHRPARNHDFQDSIQSTFICRSCGKKVSAQGAGTRNRNHCPYCLCSLHLDQTPGDRNAACGGIMDPIGVWVRRSGEWALIHRCRRCGILHSNRIAADDNPALLLSLAARPLAQPPFPLGCLEQLLRAQAQPNLQNGTEDAKPSTGKVQKN